MALDFPSLTEIPNQNPENTYSPTSTPKASTNGLTYVWNGKSWDLIVATGTGGGGIPEAPNDNFAYSRKNSTWDRNYYLSSEDNDTAKGDITFKALTTHEGGVDVVNAVINNDGSATFAGGKFDIGSGGSVRISSTSTTEGYKNRIFSLFNGDFSDNANRTLALTQDGTIYIGGFINPAGSDNAPLISLRGNDVSNPGGATFVGGNIELTTNDIIIKNVSGGTPDANYTAISRLGSVDIYRSGANPQNDTVFRLRTNPAGTELTPIEFKGDGSATFADNITMGGTLLGSGNLYAGYVDQNTYGAKIGADGSATFGSNLVVNSYISGYRQTQDDAASLITLHSDNGNPGVKSAKFAVTSDGNGTFAGSVKASRGIFRNNNNEHVIVGEATLGSANYSAIQLKTDGSASFAGNVNILKGASGVTTDTSAALTVEANGVTGRTQGLSIYGNSSLQDSYSGFALYKGASEKARINYDGSAEFAGGGMAINNAGRIQVKRNDGVDASLVFLVKDSSDNDSISMRGNGSSSFAGTVDIGNRDTGSASGSGHRLFTNSTYSALRTQVSSSATDQTIVYQVDRGTDTNKIQFTAGGSATFAGLTTHEDGVHLTGFQEVNSTENAALLSNYSFEGAAGKTVYGGYCYLAATSKQASYDGFYITGNLATTNKATGVVSGFHASGGLVNSSDTLTAGFYSHLPIGDGSNYNFFAGGDAPNYFAGNIDCDGLINGAFSLRMQTDDPTAFQTTYSTDEEGNQVENQTYIGTTEDLLSIIKDLRARVAALEGA